jgi:hypothetical protein
MAKKSLQPLATSFSVRRAGNVPEADEKWNKKEI